jgi:hypothetical protein
MSDPSSETPRHKTRLGVDKETLYIAGGLTAIGALWYYYAMVEHARIEKKRESAELRSATASVADAEGRPKVESK